MCVLVDLFVNSLIIVVGATIMWFSYKGLRPMIPHLRYTPRATPHYNRRLLAGIPIDWCEEMHIHTTNNSFDVMLFTPFILHMAVNELDRFLWMCDRYDTDTMTHHDIMVLISKININAIPVARRDYITQYRLAHPECRYIGADS